MHRFHGHEHLSYDMKIAEYARWVLNGACPNDCLPGCQKSGQQLVGCSLAQNCPQS